MIHLRDFNRESFIYCQVIISYGQTYIILFIFQIVFSYCKLRELLAIDCHSCIQPNFNKKHSASPHNELSKIFDLIWFDLSLWWHTYIRFLQRLIKCHKHKTCNFHTVSCVLFPLPNTDIVNVLSARQNNAHIIYLAHGFA